MLRVSVLELPARWAEPDAALDEVDRLLAAEPTDLAVLPEMSLCGYVSPKGDFDLSRFAEAIDGPAMEAVAKLAARHRTHVVAPLVLAEGAALYNAAVVIAPDGSRVATYRKRHPWYPELWATPGTNRPPLVQIGALTVTIAICFDGHFVEEESADVLAQADLLVFTSAWVDDEDSRVPLLRTLARRFHLSVANANWCAGVVRVPGQGGSCIVGPAGELLARLETPRTRRADAVVRRRPVDDGDDACAYAAIQRASAHDS